MSLPRNNNNQNRGFTIVELIVVIAIIAILAGISIVGYGAWRTSATKTQVQNSLNAAAAAMENHRTFNNGYPTAIPTNFTVSDNVVLSLQAGSAGSVYCIDGTSTTDATIEYYIASGYSGEGALEGTCLTRPTPPPAPEDAPASLIASTISSTQVDLSWGAAAGLGITYTVQRSTDAGFASIVGAISGLTDTTQSSTALSPGTNYFYRVRADNAGGSSDWSTVAAATTTAVLPAPVVTSSQAGPGSASFTWPAVPGATSYTLEYRINGGAWNDGLTTQNVLIYTIDAGHNSAVDIRIVAIDAGGSSSGFGVAAITTSLWATLGLVNNWSDYGGSYAPATYTKTDTGAVVLRGLMQNSGTFSSGSLIATLPAGYRPQHLITFRVEITGNDSASIKIDTDGSVIASTNTNATATALDGMTFMPAGTYTPITPLQNGWVTHSDPGVPPLGYAVDSIGRVFLQGTISSGTTTSGTVIANLPSSPDISVTPKLIVAIRSGCSGSNVMNVGTDITLRGVCVGSALFPVVMYYPTATAATWVPMTLLNGWIVHSPTTNATPEFTKASDGVVTLKGLIRSGTTTNGVVLFTLPAGYRPSATLTFSSVCDDSPCRIDIQADGSVVGRGVVAPWSSLSGINFVAEQ